MAICNACGKKGVNLYFSDKNHHSDLFFEIRDFYGLSGFSTEAACYCEECYNLINNIKNDHNYNYAYNEMKRRTINAFKKYEGSFIVNYSWFKKVDKYIDHIYQHRKFKEKNGEIQRRTNEIIKNRWNKINEEYGEQNFVFPDLPKHAHVCATTYKNNLILIENKTPILNLKNATTEEMCESAFEQFCNLDNETIFAISILPIENILSYQSTGYVEHTTVVSGGGGHGGGVNIKGAVMGGLFFGGAGAIVGSQIGTEIFINPIRSNIVEYDYRKTMLNLKNAEGKVEIKELPYYYAEVFQKVIPEKEFNFLHANKNVEVPVQISNTNMLEEMKQLKELLDIGLITQEEFDSKRKQILKL